jgi:hypothetical protein
MRISWSNPGLTGGYSTFNTPARRMRDAAAASGGFIHKQAVIGNKIGPLLQQPACRVVVAYRAPM